MRFVALLIVVLLGGLPVSAATDHELASGLSGVVRHGQGPLEHAAVYAYRTHDVSLTRVSTSRDGRFLFRTLPAGVYKVIAHKVGFVPAIVLFTRATESASDFLEFRLSEETDASFDQEDDFWSIRSKIPGDVLREIRVAEGAAFEDYGVVEPEFSVETELTAGTRKYANAGQSQVTHGRIGVESQVGGMRLSVDGRFDEMRPEALTAAAEGRASGRTDALALSMRGAGSASIQLNTVSHSLDSSYLHSSPVDMDRYQFLWSQDHGARAHSAVSAQYIEERGFNTQSMVSPVGVPLASRTLLVDGSYSQEIGESMAVRTGVSYQELIADTELGNLLPGAARQQVNAYGIASTQLSPALLVEYGLFSTLLDGSVSMSPHAGLVMNLGQEWQAETVVRQRISSEEPKLPNFSLAHYRNLENNTSTEQHYYRVGLTRQLGKDELFKVAANHREIGDTLRVFFSEDFFDQIESVYLVRGDQLPELQVALTRRLSPGILATLESNVGSGGGGIFRTDNQTSYENKVRYMVTSLDTKFQRTETALFLAVHRVEQHLTPTVAGGLEVNDLEVDKLQVKVTQDLGFFMPMASDWALLLNIELSRGAVPYAPDSQDDDLHRRVAGGIAVRF